MENLMPIVSSLYGPDLGRKLYDDVVSLRPHEGVAFFPFAPSIRAGALVLEGSVLVEDAASVSVVPLRVMFPKTYPATPPTVVVVPPQKCVVRKDHHSIRADGTVLCVPAGTRSLLEMLLGLAQGFTGSKNFPFEEMKAPTPTPLPPVVDPLLKAVEEKLRKHANEMKAEADTVRAVCTSQMEHLDASRENLLALRDALIKKKDALLQSNVEVSGWNDAVAAACDASEVLANPAQWHVLTDEQELLVADRALEDTLDVLETVLKAGTIMCEDYIREVGNVARQQFVVRALLARIERPSSPVPSTVAATPQAHFGNMVAALQRHFPQIPKVQIEQALRAANGNVDVCKQSLSEWSKEWDLCN